MSPLETAEFPVASSNAADSGAPARPPGRLASLDAFRGAIMLLMASSGLGFAEAARSHPNSTAWAFLARQTEHAQWAGCTLWDLIQPAFMFMVGVALPWSIANRRARGESFAGMLRHALARSFFLIAMAIFLTSAWSKQTEWYFTNVLAQIGLGYPFLFLLAFASQRGQWLAAALLLAGYWLFFAAHPAPDWPGADPRWAAFGIPENWPHLSGFAAHWEKNVNAAAAFDRWFLNLFPREKPFLFSTGGYQTLNFIPSLATMIFGLLAGQLLRSNRPMPEKLKILSLAGIGGVSLGLAWSALGLCPIIKRIWTPSWTFLSAGIVTLLLAAFVWIIEARGVRRWAFPLIVAGLNPIALYCMWQFMSGFVRENLQRHFTSMIFQFPGAAYAPILQRLWVLLVLWLVLFWMYRRKIFLRI